MHLPSVYCMPYDLVGKPDPGRCPLQSLWVATTSAGSSKGLEAFFMDRARCGCPSILL